MENEFRLKDISIFLDGDSLHIIGPNHEEMPISLYALADNLFNQPLDNPELVPAVIRGLKNVIGYIEEQQITNKRTLQ
jgi:hypothetical protein|tara:strand:+ start:517 stop:750 length:234 start_codon:yes stop_codon:yes gene_type:complete